jgi:hypothetical protein
VIYDQAFRGARSNKQVQIGNGNGDDDGNTAGMAIGEIWRCMQCSLSSRWICPRGSPQLRSLLLTLFAWEQPYDDFRWDGLV